MAYIKSGSIPELILKVHLSGEKIELQEVVRLDTVPPGFKVLGTGNILPAWNWHSIVAAPCVLPNAAGRAGSRELLELKSVLCSVLASAEKQLSKLWVCLLGEHRETRVSLAEHACHTLRSRHSSETATSPPPSLMANCKYSTAFLGNNGFKGNKGTEASVGFC